MKRDQINTLFSRLAMANPAPKTELDYTNPFTLLVAVVLSAQATDVGVNKATKKLFALAACRQAWSSLDHIERDSSMTNKSGQPLEKGTIILAA